MIYLTRMLGKPVVDAAGDTIGTVHDVAIATGEVFPRVTSLAFVGPDKTPFMLSWRKYVAAFDSEQIILNEARAGLRFSYLQPDEVLLHRDLLNRQIVDTQGMKVVRVNDLKLSESRNQLRLLGAEVGARGILRGLSPMLERIVVTLSEMIRLPLTENIIAWNYMDLLDRDLSHVQLSVTHKRLHELHPADMADVLEQLTPAQRAKVFEHLDNEAAAETISELEDELQAEVIDDLESDRASDILEIMDPDDAADIVGDLPYDKAEALLRLMGVRESRQVRELLGYKERTAGGIMTPEVTTVTEDMTVQQVIDHLRTGAAENENIYYIYVVGPKRVLTGVMSLRDLIVSDPATPVVDLVERDVFTVGPDDDQEQVADLMSKYDLLAMPVVDESGRLLGMVTVDDALDVMEQEAEEDLAIATGRGRRPQLAGLGHWLSHNGWLPVWALVFVGAALGARFMQDAVFLQVLLYSPIVLRVAEDVAAHVMARVIGSESGEPTVGLWRRVLGDGLMGLAVGAAVSLVWLVVGTLMQFATTPPSLGSTVLLVMPFGLAILLVTLAGTVVGWAAQRRADTDKPLSQIAVSVFLMLLGEAGFLGFYVAASGLATRLYP